jgi:UDP-3-O-[3-hydroxymyristoyl] glucosamine N-acyltransferase
MMVGEGVAVRNDKMSILLSFADASIGTVNCFSNGSKSFPKESLEIFSEAAEKEWILPALVHPSAVISPSAKIHAGTVVMANAVVNAMAHLLQLGSDFA